MDYYYTSVVPGQACRLIQETKTGYIYTIHSSRDTPERFRYVAARELEHEALSR
jgi:hypothetical protein